MRRTAIILAALMILASMSFGQMSAVGYNSQPSPTNKTAKGPSPDQVPSLSAQSQSCDDFTITQPNIETGGETGSDNNTTVIPEPATLILIGVGLAAIGVRRRFRA